MLQESKIEVIIRRKMLVQTIFGDRLGVEKDGRGALQEDGDSFSLLIETSLKRRGGEMRLIVSALNA